MENGTIARYKKRGYKKKASKNVGELTVLPIAPLTTEEEGDRYHLERKVERAFYEAGMALMELRDRRLYRSTHATFEEYCRDRFDYTRRRPYQLIEAALIYDNLIKKCVKFLHILPTKEGQVQPLSQLEREEQPSAWITAVEEAGGKVPPGRIVKDNEKEIPDLAIEVVFSSGGVADLKKYQTLNVKEVWFWQQNQLKIYWLTDASYVLKSQSYVLSKLDSNLLDRFIQRGFNEDQLTIEAEFIEELER